jgi:methylglutamate dehydrogenase subunit A
MPRPTEHVRGERERTAYLRGLFADWRAPGIDVVLHEKRGGYANNAAAVTRLAAKVRAADVEIRTGELHPVSNSPFPWS